MSDRLAPLRWHRFATREYQAWSTHDGQPAPHWFRIEPTHQGLKLSVEQVGAGAPALPVVVMHFSGEWAIEHVQEIAERQRALLPVLGPESFIPLAEIERQIAARQNRPTRCFFHHVFPLDANDSTQCQCGRLTKGLYESQRIGEGEGRPNGG